MRKIILSGQVHKNVLTFSPLKQKAVTAIGAILSDNSELRELWEENEELYEAWKEDKLSMQKRLQQ